MKTKIFNITVIYFALFQSEVYSQSQSQNQYSNILPDDKKIELDSQYKKMYENEKVKNVKLLEQLEKNQAALPEKSGEFTAQSQNMNTGSQDMNKMLDKYNQALNYDSSSSGVAPATLKNENSKVKSKSKIKNVSNSINSSSIFATQATSFNVSGYGGAQTVLPAGSAVHITFLTGLEAVKGTERDLLFETDTVFDGPNGKKIDFRNCRITAKGTADLSIERVIIIPKKISCVRKDGAYFDRSITGYVAGKDNSYGQIGIFQSKQGQVFMQALLAKVVGATSAAIAFADTSSQIAVGNAGAPQSITNVTGDKLQYGILSGTAQSAQLITEWYLDQAKSLLPSIATPSGAKGWVITTEPILIPTLDLN